MKTTQARTPGNGTFLPAESEKALWNALHAAEAVRQALSLIQVTAEADGNPRGNLVDGLLTGQEIILAEVRRLLLGRG